MNIRPTSSGGRVIEGNTPFGVFRVEWDAKARLIGESITITHPAEQFISDEHRAVISVRLPICQPCEHYRGHSVMNVLCAKCGGCTGGLSLISGECKENKWPKP